MKKISAIVACAFLFGACQKNIKVPDLNFNVKLNQTTYKVGDTVKFMFTGNPDNITFFSGEPGRKYEYRDRLKAEGAPQFQFTSYRQYGTQENSLHVLASTDFNGVIDENIGSANWSDITKSVTLSTGSDNTPSGIISLKQLDNDKPLYLAFKFTGEISSTQRTWTIKDFSVQNVLKDGMTLDVANMSNISWTAVSVKNPDKVWAIAADQIKIAGGAANTPDNEDWIVTKALNLSAVQPDRGVALKNITTHMGEYDYVFEKPGNYVVTFLVSNATVDEQKSALKQLNIVIEP